MEKVYLGDSIISFVYCQPSKMNDMMKGEAT